MEAEKNAVYCCSVVFILQNYIIKKQKIPSFMSIFNTDTII